MSHSVLEITNEFIKLEKPTMRPSQLRLQKLCHIANGWNWAIFDERLITEDAEAWKNGPVFRELWDHIRFYGHNDKSYLLTEPNSHKSYTANLNHNERAVIDHVWKRYKNLSERELTSITHQSGAAWEKAYFGRGRNSPLRSEDIKEHFVKLAEAGRAQAERNAKSA